jgi:hypothetical protein
MIDDDGSGTTGTIINNAWKQEFYNQIDGFGGVWTKIPFDTANFGGSGGMVWTIAAGNVQTNHYTIIGKTLIWLVVITDTTLTGTPSDYVQLILPPGVTYPISIQATGQLFLPTVGWGISLITYTGGTVLKVYKSDSVAFPAVGTGFYLSFQVVLPID